MGGKGEVESVELRVVPQRTDIVNIILMMLI